MKKFGVVMAVAFVLLEAYLALSIVTFSHVNETPRSEVGIVLGAAVWGDKPSPVFEERIKHAIALYQQGIIAKILFTGGVGNGKDHAESAVAQQYAMAHGVPRSDILTEAVSTTTQQNLTEARQLLVNNDLHSAILISDPLHMKRAVMMAKEIGLNVASSPTFTSRYTSLSAKTKFLFRELYFYQEYLAFE
ncbi:YdcF family protein [Pokkaliibacter sp. CJK22405]|uniref:YdcF family protein n=1 Tax=Pokkaliibacter sp. CJK22405 TaxID=3384615 RepID=UPI0039856231